MRVLFQEVIATRTRLAYYSGFMMAVGFWTLRKKQEKAVANTKSVRKKAAEAMEKCRSLGDEQRSNEGKMARFKV